MQPDLPLAYNNIDAQANKSPIVGLRVRLDRHVDRLLACHDNIAIVGEGRGPHAAQLRCIQCNRHRGWLSHATFNFLSETVRLFGVPSELFVIHDASLACANKGDSPMHLDKLFPGKYLTAADLDGEDVTLTINKVRVQEIGRDGKEKPVLHFTDEAKGLILNKTNANAIGELYGKEVDNWHDKKVTLFPSTTDFAGDPETPCIRTKAPPDYVKPAATPKKPLKDDLDVEIPDYPSKRK